MPARVVPADLVLLEERDLHRAPGPGDVAELRRGRPLLFVDIAVPRDIAQGVAELADVTVLDLEDLSAWADRGRAQRLGEVDQVLQIVGEEVERFAAESAALQAAPLVAALRQRAETHRAAELERYAKRLAHLDDTQRELIESITRRLICSIPASQSIRVISYCSVRDSIPNFKSWFRPQ